MFNEILRILGTLHNDLQEQTSAIREAARMNNKQRQNPLPVPLSVVAELKVPEAKEIQSAKRDNRAFAVQVWLASVTTLAFIAAAIYAGVAARQLGQMKIAAEAARNAADTASKSLADTRAIYRPFIVVWDTPIRLDIQKKRLIYSIDLMDASEVPASHFSGECEMFLNQSKVTGKPNPARPKTVGAHDRFSLCGGRVDPPEFDSVVTSGEANFRIYVHGTYDGPAAGNYKYCDELQYAKDFGRFFDMGECDLSKPFPQ